MSYYSLLAYTLYFTTILSTAVQAQSRSPLDLGTENPEISWKSYSNDAFVVVAPEPYEAGLDSLLSTMTKQFLDHKNEITYYDRSIRIPVIIHPYTSIPNGFVSRAPFRSELYMTPPQESFLGWGSWQTGLAIHEYRHVLQATNTKFGYVGLLQKIFGGLVWSGTSTMLYPNWYTEGDAVFAETQFTNGGRGRLPSFDMEWRAQLLLGKKFTYEKARSGSFKDFVPDHYHTGFILINEGRKAYGPTIWKEVANSTARRIGFFPFSGSLKKFGSLGTKGFYRQSFDRYSQFVRQFDSGSDNPLHLDGKRYYSSYRFPKVQSGRSLIAQYSSFKTVPQLIELDENGGHTKIVNLGYNLDANQRIDVRDHLLVWSEYVKHPRWHETYGQVIVLYNRKAKVRQQITADTSLYFSPQFSIDGRLVVALRYYPNSGRYAIQELTLGGKITRSVLLPPFVLPVHPVYTNPDQVVSTLEIDGKQGIYSINLETGKYKELVKPQPAQLTRLTLKDTLIYFTATYTGTNQIYSVNLNDRSVRQYTNSPTGAFDPTIYEDKVVYSFYTNLGYKLGEVPDSGKVILVENLSNVLNGYLAGTAEVLDENDRIEGKSSFTTEVSEDRYKEAKRLVNIHSLTFEYDGQQVEGTVHLRDVFNAAEGEVSVQAGLNSLFSIHANWTYGRRLIQFTPYLNYSTNRQNSIGNRGELGDVGGSSIQSGQAGMEFSIPLSSAKKNWIHQVKPYAKFGYLQYNNRISVDSVNYEIDRGAPLLSLGVNAGGRSRRAYRELASDWGYNFQAEARRLLNNRTHYYHIARLFTPGFSKTHTLQLGWRVDVQNIEGLEDYSFPVTLVQPYQYTNHFFFFNRGAEVELLYGLPLLYPDLALGPLAFIKRVRTEFGFRSFFSNAATYVFMHENVELVEGFRYQTSFIRLYTDLKLVRELDLSIGIEVGYRPDIIGEAIYFGLAPLSVPF